MSIDRSYIYFWGAILSGVLTVVMFIYTNVVVPVWDGIVGTYYSWMKPAPTPSPQPTSTTVANSVRAASNSKTPSSTPPPTIAPVTTPSPAPVVERSSVTKTGKNEWKVILTSTSWFDTGIRYITNYTLNVNKPNSDTDSNTLIKLNGQTFRNSEGRQIYFFDSNGFSPNIRDTVKLKLDNPGRSELIVAVSDVSNICRDWDNHRDIHLASSAWAQAR